MKKTKIIDCTLREVGYQTDWNFEDSCVQNIYDFAYKHNVWCVELGFCHKRSFDPGKGRFRYCGSENVRIQKKKHTYIAVMRDIQRPSSELLCKNLTDIDIIRIMTRSNEIDYEILFKHILEVQNKGYDYFVNFTNAGENSMALNSEIIRFAKCNDISKIVFADTNSTMQEKNVKIIIEQCHNYDIEVGMHFHNQHGNAIHLAKEALEAGVDYLDVTHLGMGGKYRVGNLPMRFFVNDSDIQYVESILQSAL